jgi:L-amino acid N-acyltransferase YncA
MRIEPMTAEHATAVLAIYQRIGQHHGRWRDVVLIERRSPLT